MTHHRLAISTPGMSLASRRYASFRRNWGLKSDRRRLKFAGKFRVHYTETFHGKPFLDDEVAFVYVCDRPVALSELKLQKEEVEAVGWFDLEETWQAVLRHDPMYCVPRGGLEVLRVYMRESDFFV